MLIEKHSEMLKVTLSHQAELEHRERMNILYENRDAQVTELASMLKITPYKDGNQWCVLWGENIQEGICGFGDTPFKALLDFNNNYMSEIIPPIHQPLKIKQVE